MIIKTTKDGTLHTDCSHQHNLAVTCGECSEVHINKALKYFEQGKRASEEGISIGNLKELNLSARESYISGYVAGIPFTPEWATIKNNSLAQIGRLTLNSK